ncbi:MAG: hypothetical protein ACOC80_13940, partial [Petrotogales bacterium]
MVHMIYWIVDQKKKRFLQVDSDLWNRYGENWRNHYAISRGKKYPDVFLVNLYPEDNANGIMYT